LTILDEEAKESVLACKRSSQGVMTKQSSGFSLVELMVVVTVIAVLMALVAPSYQKMIERNRLKEATQGFKSDVQLARMEAIKRSRDTIFHRTAGDDGDWCYGISTVACDCEQADDTAIDFCDVKRISGASFPVVSLATGSTSVFDSRRGTSAQLSSVFTTRHYAAQVAVSVGGRVVVCNPDPMPVDVDGVALQGIYGACGG